MFDTHLVNCSQQNSSRTPFLSEAFDLSLEPLDSENVDRSEFHQICLHIFRHACELDNVNLTGVFASVGRSIRNVELDIRNPVAQTRCGEELRGQKRQYVEIIVRKLDTYLF